MAPDRLEMMRRGMMPKERFKALREQFHRPNYIENPVVFSYSSFYSGPYKLYNLIDVEGQVLADYWYSAEDRYMGSKDGQIAVGGSDHREVHDNAKLIIKRLTGAKEARFTTDSP